MDTKRIAKLSMLLSISVVLGLIESFIPIMNGTVPGIKLGLANIVIVFAIYELSFKDAIYISVLRVLLIGILRTGLFSISFFFSLAGALLSIVFMFLVKEYTKMSIVGVSVVGSIFHSIAQIIVACIFLSNINIVYYLPILLISSIVTGVIVGSISSKLVEYYNN